MTARPHGATASTGEKHPTLEEPLRELESQKRDRRQILEEAEDHRREANAFKQLAAAIVESSDIDELLTRALDVFALAAGADASVIRLREGERLKSRAALGLEEEVASGFSMPVQAVVRDPRAALFAATDPEATSEALRSKDLRGLYCAPLFHGEDIVGAVFFAAPVEREFSPHDRRLVGALATTAAAAIVRRFEFDALRQGLRAREEVLGVVAHDLRNPITAIGTTANSLLQRVSDAALRRPVERIVRGAQRACSRSTRSKRGASRSIRAPWKWPM